MHLTLKNVYGLFRTINVSFALGSGYLEAMKVYYSCYHVDALNV